MSKTKDDERQCERLTARSGKEEGSVVRGQERGIGPERTWYHDNDRWKVRLVLVLGFEWS